MNYFMRWRRPDGADEEESVLVYANITMIGIRSLMMEFEMNADAVWHPEWPERRDFDDPAAYQSAVDHVLAFHGPDGAPGIPLHKLTSNDGWVVSPDEIAASLEQWEFRVIWDGEDEVTAVVAGRLEDRADRWDRWIEFLTGALTHDGFTVF